MPEIQPPSVLVVEDEVASLRLLAGYLEQEGYEVHTATNSSDAENILNEKSIDVVLLDIRIPGKDGLADVAVCVDPDGTMIELIQVHLHKWSAL